MSPVKAILRASSLAALLLTTAAFGSEAPPAAEATASATAKPAEEVVCRDRLRPGSHIKTRLCLTSAQWAAPNPWFEKAAIHGGSGAWGAVSTAGASVGMNAFTGR